MENEKYYTPEPTEIHPGFECEYRPRTNRGLVGWVQDNHEFHIQWLPLIVKKDFPEKLTEELFNEMLDGMPRSIDNIIDVYLKHGAIRVKHLDRSDIESLGWVLHEESTNWYKRPIDNNYPDCFFHLTPYRPEGDSVLRYIIETDMIIVSAAGIDPYEHKNRHHHVFVGIIKNKSELKRLMKQLNIITE